MTSPAWHGERDAGDGVARGVGRDPDGSVARVEFYAGTTLLNVDTTAPYAFAWANVTDGSYSLTAHAVDNYGLRATSAAVAIVVSTRVTAVSCRRPPW